MKTIRKDVEKLLRCSDLSNGNAIDVRLLRSLSNSILKTRIDGHEILYFSGKLVGEEFGKRLGRCDVKKFSTSITELIGGLKIGRIESVCERKNGMLIRVSDCPLCDPGKPNGDTRCHFSAGLLAGMASEAMQRDTLGREIDCKSSDENVCVFKLDFL
jgi:predicted hydrocarbon binding protein